jgi:hypothetical protein
MGDEYRGHDGTRNGAHTGMEMQIVQACVAAANLHGAGEVRFNRYFELGVSADLPRVQDPLLVGDVAAEATEDSSNADVDLPEMLVQMEDGEVYGEGDKGARRSPAKMSQMQNVQLGSSQKGGMNKGRVFSFYVKGNERLLEYVAQLSAHKELSQIIVDLLEARMNSEPEQIKNRIADCKAEITNLKQRLQSVPARDAIRESMQWNKKDFDLMIFNLKLKGSIIDAKRKINEAVQNGNLTIDDAKRYEL